MSDKVEGALSVPPATVAGLSLMGVSLQDGVLIATLIWITTQFGWFCYNRYKDWKNGRGE